MILLREITIIVSKLFALLVHVFIRIFLLHFVVGCLLFNPLLFYFFLLILYFLFILNHLNTVIITVTYYFKNSISIFATIPFLSMNYNGFDLKPNLIYQVNIENIFLASLNKLSEVKFRDISRYVYIYIHYILI